MSISGCGLIAWPAVVLACCGASAARDRAVALVRIYENPAVSAAMLERSQEKVAAILSLAGAEVIWRFCAYDLGADPDCAAAPRSNEAVVRLVSGPPPASAPGCGVALVPAKATAHFISVFPDCVRSASDRLNVREDVVLAYCLAHEIGHIFMGASHGTVGVMQARPRHIDLDRFAHGGLGFTPAEGRKLRERLRRLAVGQP